MSRCRKKLGTDTSGQLLIVAAFIIAVLISSTTVYVYELNGRTSSSDSQLTSDYVLALEQSVRNTVISSLANVSSGGNRSALSANLCELSQIVRSVHHFGICDLAFTLFNDSYYDSGIWLSSNTTDVAVSSAFADFTLNITDIDAKAAVSFAVNVTTALVVNGSYTIEGTEKHVNLICRVYNEGRLALTDSIKVFYENTGNWTQIEPSNLSIVDYGDGSYLLSFVVPLDVVNVSVCTVDLRGIHAEARYSLP